MWNKIKDIISQYLSIEETRKSIIVLVLIGLVITGLYKAYLGNDIPPNLSTLIMGLASIIFGTNVGNTVSTIYSSYVNGKINNQNINVDEYKQVENVSQDDSHINGSI